MPKGGRESSGYNGADSINSPETEEPSKRTKVLFFDAPFHSDPELAGQALSDAGFNQEIPRGALSVATYLKKEGFEPSVVPLDAFINVEILEKQKEFFDINVPESTRRLQRQVIADGFFPQILAETIDAKIAEIDPKVIGISYMFSGTNPVTKKMLEYIRQKYPAIRIIIGGNAATFDGSIKEELLRPDLIGATAIVDYEGEWTTDELLKKLESLPEGQDLPLSAELGAVAGIEYWDEESRSVKKTPRRHRGDPAEVGALNYDLISLPAGVDINEFNHYVLLSRGCKGACKFCTSARGYRREVSSIGSDEFARELNYVASSVDKLKDREKNIGILDDDLMLQVEDGKTVFESIEPTLLEIHRQYPEINFIAQGRVGHLRGELDPNLPVKMNPEANTLVPDRDGYLKRLNRAGIKMLLLGIESGSQEILDATAKHMKKEWIRPACESLKKAGIDVGAFWIVGLPGSTRERELESLEFLRDLADDGLIDELESHVFYPLPGTTARLDKRLKLDVDTERRSSSIFDDQPVFERVDENGKVVLSKSDIAEVFAETKKIADQLRQKKLAAKRQQFVNIE